MANTLVVITSEVMIVRSTILRIGSTVYNGEADHDREVDYSAIYITRCLIQIW